MYNRYIPATNGHFECQTVNSPHPDPPPVQEGTSAEQPCIAKNPCSQESTSPDIGDLLLLCIVLLLLLDSNEEDLNTLLITAAAFILLQ